MFDDFFGYGALYREEYDAFQQHLKNIKRQRGVKFNVSPPPKPKRTKLNSNYLIHGGRRPV